MQSQTRDIMSGTMLRRWLVVYHGIAPGHEYHYAGTADDAVADFRRRFPATTLQSHHLVMDDDCWTIRGTWADGSVATLFAAD